MTDTSTTQARNGLGITTLVLGGAAMLFTLFAAAAPALTASGYAFVAILIALIALGFGVAALRRIRHGQATNKSVSRTGTGLGIAALVLSAGIAAWAESQVADLRDLISAPADRQTGSGADNPAPTGNSSTSGRDNPVQAGAPITVGDWEVVVHTANLDATDQVLDENEFNDGPVDGRQFVMAPVTVTYNGTETGTPWLDLQFTVVGSAGNTFGIGSMDDDCGVVPDALNDVGEMFAGATAEGNVCVAVPSEQVDGAVWAVENSFEFGEPAFVALR